MLGTLGLFSWALFLLLDDSAAPGGVSTSLWRCLLSSTISLLALANFVSSSLANFFGK